MTNYQDNRQIRVFISSTFRDMQDERDELMKKTFPMLRQMAAERDVTLTEIDLRWGITEEESKSGKVVEICLREIENSVPFFIGIIGNRYGWIPKPEDIGGSLTERFPKVPEYVERHLSVTEMEMQFGVLARPEDMHAYFFIKEPEIPDKEEPKKLDDLKKAVRANKRYPVSNYSSREDLARQVEEAFRKLLDDLFPAGALSALEKERLGQRAYMNSLCQIYIRAKKNYAAIDKWMEDWEKHQLVITGASGLGKSALVANWTRDKLTKEKDLPYPYKIVYHAVGSGGSLGSDWHVVKSLCDEIRDLYGFDGDQTAPKTDEKALQELFDRVAFEGDKPLLIVLDAINQIVDVNHSKRLNWLPIPPKNVKILFTTLEDDETMQVFQDRHYPVFTLRPLTRRERIRMVRKYLSIFSKKLKPEQVARIVDDRQSVNTLVMKTLLDELVNFGIYERLDEKIEEFLKPDSYEDFYQVLLQNYEAAFKEQRVRHFLSLIAVSRNGLSEDEILSITQEKPLRWSQFFCSFRQHLIVKNGLVSFSHGYIREAVEDRYINGNKEWERTCREEIVAALENETTPEGKKTTRSLDEVPYQLEELGALSKLHDYLIDLDVFSYLSKNEETLLGKCWWKLIDAGYLFSEYHSIVDGVKNPARQRFIKELRDFNGIMHLDEDSCMILEEQMLQYELESLLNDYQIHFGENHPYAETFSSKRRSITDVASSALLKEYALTSLEIRKSLYGSNHLIVADSFDKLVDISKLVFIWGRVTYYYSHRYDPELGEFLNNPDIFSYKKEADTSEETEWRRKSLEIRKKVLGDKHIDVARAFIAIGGKNNNLRALDILRSIYGDSHPDVAKAYIAVGGESNNLKAIAILRSLYGDNHPDVAKAYQSIGGLGNNLMALRIMSTLYGEFFNDGANLCKEIAKGYFEEANLAKAVEYKIKELELRKKRFNEDNHFPLIGMTVDDFFSIYGKQQVLDFLNDSQIVPLEKKNLIIPNTIREIGERAFFDCQLTEVTIPESVTCIGYKAFEFCERLTKINLPNSVTVIESDAFSHCSKLTSIRIPDYVNRIANTAFWGCTGLKTLSIPKDLDISTLDLPEGVQIVRRI